MQEQAFAKAQSFKNEAEVTACYTLNVCDNPRKISDEARAYVDVIQTKTCKSASKKCALAGDEIQYTITFTNFSSVDLFNVKIKDRVPKNTKLVPGSICPEPDEGETLECGINVGTVRKHQTVTLTFKVCVEESAGCEIKNKAFVCYCFKCDCKEIQEGCQESNEVVTCIVNPKIILSKESDKCFVSEDCEEVTFTLSAFNAGDVPLENVVAVDNIPKGMKYKPCSTLKNGGLPYTDENPECGIKIGCLAPCESYKIEFTVIAKIDKIPCGCDEDKRPCKSCDPCEDKKPDRKPCKDCKDRD